MTFRASVAYSQTILAAACWSSLVVAEVQTKEIAYTHGGKQYKGTLAWDDAQTGQRPGVLLVHEWWGLDDYAKNRARQLAELGYVAFALDMYGRGQVTKHPEEAGVWASQVRENVEEWQSRALAGLNVLKEQEQTDASQLAAIGYCFGGSTVLQMAYAGAPVLGVVSFHGALVPPTESAKNDVKVLVCHGAEDAFIPPEKVQAWEQAMNKVKADYQLVSYSGARHGFTNPDAGEHGMPNLQHDEAADRRSWRQMQVFFGELFGTDPAPSR